MTTDTQKETLGFQAEVTQLLDLMIHSLYSNKEIFLRELVSNASDAVDRLRFDALSDAALYEKDSDFKIRVAYDKDARTITVSDNGIGVEPKYKTWIFGLFRRLHGRDVPGSGLGLAMCRRIVEQFGGTIWLESEVGKGSCFYFTVPSPP